MPEESDKRPGRPTNDAEGALGHIHVRVTLERKRSYVQASRPGKLSEWIIDQLDKAANFKPTENK